MPAGKVGLEGGEDNNITSFISKIEHNYII